MDTQTDRGLCLWTLKAISGTLAVARRSLETLVVGHLHCRFQYFFMDQGREGNFCDGANLPEAKGGRRRVKAWLAHPRKTKKAPRESIRERRIL